MESWLKNLSNEYIYAEQNPNRTWDIWIQSWPFRSRKRPCFSTKYWLWRQVPEKWEVTRGFMVWFFLSWGIDYRKKNKKTKFGRITSWNFVHPISHCARLDSCRSMPLNGLFYYISGFALSFGNWFQGMWRGHIKLNVIANNLSTVHEFLFYMARHITWNQFCTFYHLKEPSLNLPSKGSKLL